MNRLIYLYELDSVRKEASEIEIAQKALFREIVLNGNTVVLSFNQLTDSEAFLSLIKNDETYQHILKLFQYGAIKVSRYGSYRTASQYVQDCIDKCLKETVEIKYTYGEPIKITDEQMTYYDEEPVNLPLPQPSYLYKVQGAFWDCDDKKARTQYEDIKNGKNVKKNKYLFSGIPVKSTERKLLEDIKDALRYNALEILYERLEKVKSDKKKLDNGINLANREEIENDYRRLPFLINYVNMLISMSMEQLASNKPKEGGGIKFSEHMKSMLQMDYSQIENLFNIHDDTFCSIVEEAKTILEEILGDYTKSGNPGMQNRSLWIDDINKKHQSKGKPAAMAIAIVDMCYNYTIEDSIDKVSKCYEENDFEKDYLFNLYVYWKNILDNKHLLTKDEKEFNPNPIETELDWETAVRVAEGVYKNRLAKENRQKKKQDNCEVQNQDFQDTPVRATFHQEQRKWKRVRTKNQLIYFLYTFIYIIVFCVVEWIKGLAEGVVANIGIPKGFLYDVIISMILFGILGSIVSNKLNLPDILESMKNIGKGLKDCYNIHRASKNDE